MTFVSNDTAMGIFRPVLANTVNSIELRKPGVDAHKTINTTDAIEKILRENYYADQQAYLKCRLVDFLISDFDRHTAQWSWGVADTQQKIFYPIPKDRDQVLYNNKGLIMKIASKGHYAFMTNFTDIIKHFKNFGRVGPDLDHAYVVKGDLRLIAFNDIGRVWMDNENSSKWHDGYGGSIYLVPFNAVMVSFVAGISDEDIVYHASLGAKMNVTFQRW